MTVAILVITCIILIHKAKQHKEVNDQIYYRNWSSMDYRDKTDVG
jgi:hypothetical protein